MIIRIKCDLNWAGSGSPGVNTWHARTADLTVPDEIDAVLGDLVTFYTSIAEIFPAGFVVNVGSDVTDVEAQEDQTRAVTPVGATGLGVSLPTATMMCIGWRTTLKARRGMGRTFLGPLEDRMCEANGTPTATALSIVRGAAQTLLDAQAVDAGYSLGVWGLQDAGQYDAQGKLIPGQPRVLRDFTSFAVRDSFAVLRSRRD